MATNPPDIDTAPPAITRSLSALRLGRLLVGINEKATRYHCSETSARSTTQPAIPDTSTARKRDHSGCDERYQRDLRLAVTVGGRSGPAAGVPQRAIRAAMRGVVKSDLLHRDWVSGSETTEGAMSVLESTTAWSSRSVGGAHNPERSDVRETLSDCRYGSRRAPVAPAEHRIGRLRRESCGVERPLGGSIGRWSTLPCLSSSQPSD